MILVGFICFFVGAFTGIFIAALMIAMSDKDRKRGD